MTGRGTKINWHTPPAAIFMLVTRHNWLTGAPVKRTLIAYDH